MSLFHLNNQSITRSSNQAGIAGGVKKVGAKKASEQASKQATMQASKQASKQESNHPLTQPTHPPDQLTNQTCSHSNDNYVFQHIQNKLWKETMNGLNKILLTQIYSVLTIYN